MVHMHDMVHVYTSPTKPYIVQWNYYSTEIFVRSKDELLTVIKDQP